MIKWPVSLTILGFIVVYLIIGCASRRGGVTPSVTAANSTEVGVGTREADTPQTGPLVVAEYLPDYRLRDWSPSDLGPLTDLIYFGIEPPADGTIDKDVISQEVLSLLRAVRDKQGCRLLLCVGGGGRSNGFADMAADLQARKRFVEGISRWCMDNGFAGIDYDWEHPRGDKQIADYASLIVETKRRFDQTGLMVTVAQAVWLDLGKQTYEVVDRVHLMSYNHPYPQATVMKSWIDVQRVLGWGCPPGKLTLGIPFYGRNLDHEAKPYRELIQGQKSGPTVDVIGGYAFNGADTIRAKTRYAIENGLAGIMVWELGQDAHEGASLLNAIGDGSEDNLRE